jgi:hypothetical protein
VFPGLIVGGLGLQALLETARRRAVRVTNEPRRLALGCLVAALVLVPLSSVVAGGWTAWTGFFANLEKHAGMPLTDDMGLKTIVAFEPGTRAALSAPLHLDADPFELWKEARRRVFHERRYVYAVLVLAFLLLYVRAVKGQEAWVAAVLGIGLIPIASELTSYYYSVLLVFAFLWPHREGIGVGLCLLSATTCLAPALLEWNDEVFTTISVATVAVVVFATASLARAEGPGRPCRGLAAAARAKATRPPPPGQPGGYPGQCGTPP